MSDALFGFLGAIIGAIITGLFLRRKTNADATDSISAAAVKIAKTAVDDLIDPLVARITGLEEQAQESKAEISRLKLTLDRYAKRVIYLMSGIETLLRQIKSKGDTPCWSPDEWSPDNDEDDDE